MVTRAVRLRVTGREPNDRLFNEFYERYDGTLAEVFGQLLVVVHSDGDDGVQVARNVVEQLERDMALHVESVDLDLVGVSDIARRLGRTRQSVQQLVDGSRGPGGFPAPSGAPGGSRVWDWASVSEWARTRLNVCDEDEPLSREEAAVVNGWLAGRNCRRDLAVRERRMLHAQVFTHDVESEDDLGFPVLHADYSAETMRRASVVRSVANIEREAAVG